MSIKSRLRYAIISLASIVLILGIFAIAGCRIVDDGESLTTTAHRGGPEAVCPIDGMPTTEANLHRRPLAVMVENHPAARPQSGLDQACAVYEGITEGGITRFLAIYLHENPMVIGPVRSARPHFINLAREYQGAYVHCGESYEALQILATDRSIYNLDQFKYGKPFWRDHSRKAPHNLYSSSDDLRKEMKRLDWEGTVNPLPHFTSTQQEVTGGEPAPAVTIKFSTFKYTVRLVYDAKRGGYVRYMDGQLHIDRETGEPLVARNVLIQYVEAAPFADSTKGTFDVEVVGNGTGKFISGGRMLDMRWSKPNIYAITSFTDKTDNPLPFQSGQTWIELVQSNGKVTVEIPKN